MGHYIEERRHQIGKIDKKLGEFSREKEEKAAHGAMEVVLKEGEAKIIQQLKSDEEALRELYKLASKSITHKIAHARVEILMRTLKTSIESIPFIESEIRFNDQILYPSSLGPKLSKAFRSYPGIFNQALEEGIKQGNQKFLNCIEAPDVPLLPFKKQIMPVVMPMEETLEGNFRGHLPTALSGVDLYYLYFPYSDNPELRLVIQPSY